MGIRKTPGSGRDLGLLMEFVLGKERGIGDYLIITF